MIIGDKKHNVAMSENQHIEWKSAWRDEYLKWICGFANAGGGRLELGKDDNGEIVGLTDARKLMEVLPNKIRDVLGIIVDVNLHSEQGKEWIAVNVEPCPYPISYKGQYHYRSGSTKQELRGASLTGFLLKKQGKRWDSIPVPNVGIDDLSPSAFDYFRKKATQTNRLDRDVLKEKDGMLLQKLRLEESGFLKRAALLLFHPDPEQFFTGAYVKIGYFRTRSDLRYQDEIHGCLFDQVEKTMDLLLSKYMAAYIRYEGLYRIEEYLYPEPALREALLNALAHKDYSSGNPIQIKVYDDRITFWNAGELPSSLTVDSLMRDHSSIPYNPDVATTFFRAGLIEAWGRGTLMIIDECKKAHLPPPVFSNDSNGFGIEFKVAPRKTSGKTSGKTSVKTSVKILELVRKDSSITIPQMANSLGLTTRAVEMQISKLKEENQIRRIGPDKGGRWEVVEEEH